MFAAETPLPVSGICELSMFAAATPGARGSSAPSTGLIVVAKENAEEEEAEEEADDSLELEALAGASDQRAL